MSSNTIDDLLESVADDNDRSDDLVKNLYDEENDLLDSYGDAEIALSIHLELTLEQIEDVDECSYGDNNYEYDGIEYFCADKNDTDEACADYIEETLWTFNTSFLEYYGYLDNMDSSDVDLVLNPLREMCEDGNSAIKALVNWGKNSEKIVEDAISADGIGHFLGYYDGNCDEVEVNNEAYFICRRS